MEKIKNRWHTLKMLQPSYINVLNPDNFGLYMLMNQIYRDELIALSRGVGEKPKIIWHYYQMVFLLDIYLIFYQNQWN